MSEARTQRGTRELRLSARGDELRLRLLELALHLVGGDRGGCRGCRGEGVLVRVGGRRGRLRRRACGEQGCEVRLLRHDLLGARPVPLLHLGPHLLTRRAGGGARGWDWRCALLHPLRLRCAPPPPPPPPVYPSSTPSASGVPLLQPLRLRCAPPPAPPPRAAPLPARAAAGAARPPPPREAARPRRSSAAGSAPPWLGVGVRVRVRSGSGLG